jgi:hypothetical protein
MCFLYIPIAFYVLGTALKVPHNMRASTDLLLLHLPTTTSLGHPRLAGDHITITLTFRSTIFNTVQLYVTLQLAETATSQTRADIAGTCLRQERAIDGMRVSGLDSPISSTSTDIAG